MAWSQEGLQKSLKAWRARRDRAAKMAKKRAAQLAAWRPRKLSAQGISMLKREEGVIPYAYNDPLKFATFGVGHLLHRSPVTPADTLRWGSKARPRPDLVDPTLRSDLKAFEDAVRKATGNKLKKQHQFDACISLAFNIGIGGFESSTVARKIRAGDLRGAADAFLLWDNPPILRPRRERERLLFLTGKYPFRASGEVYPSQGIKPLSDERGVSLL